MTIAKHDMPHIFRATCNIIRRGDKVSFTQQYFIFKFLSKETL